MESLEAVTTYQSYFRLPADYFEVTMTMVGSFWTVVFFFRRNGEEAYKRLSVVVHGILLLAIGLSVMSVVISAGTSLDYALDDLVAYVNGKSEFSQLEASFAINRIKSVASSADRAVFVTVVSAFLINTMWVVAYLAEAVAEKPKATGPSKDDKKEV